MKSNTKTTKGSQPLTTDTEVITAEKDKNLLLDDDEQSSLLMEVSIIATIAGMFIGPGNITEFPMNVLEHGGIWFVAAHIFFVFFLGLPIVFFELLIGQISRKGTFDMYGTYCKAAKGVGVTFFLISIVVIPILLNMDIDTPGINLEIILSAFRSGKDEIMYCGSDWNTQNCISLYQSSKECVRFNDTAPQLAYVNGSCISVINNRILTDSMTEYSTFIVSNPSTEFNLKQFLSILFIIIAPMVLVFFDVKYTFYTFAIIFFVYFTLYLINLLLIITMIRDFKDAFGYIWHRTNYASLLNPKALNALTSGVLWTLSLFGAVAPVGSYLRPNDRTFRIILAPVILDLVVSILSVGMIAGALSSLRSHAPASEYLYATVLDGTHGLVLYTQLLFTYVDSVTWVAIFSLNKIIGLMGKMSFIVLSFKSLFRDHLINKDKKRFYYLAAYVLFVITLTVTTCMQSANLILQQMYKVPIHKAVCKMLYLIGLIVCISVYGEIDFHIDAGRIYNIREDWRRFFSPIGPVVLFCWKQFIPIILVLSQSFVFLRSLYIFRQYQYSAIIPLAVALIAPIWAIIIVIKEVLQRKPVLDAFLPSPDHPAYKRITGKEKTT